MKSTKNFHNYYVDNCIIDALGFAGLKILHMLRESDEKNSSTTRDLELFNIDGNDWGDVEGREQSIKRRLLNIVAELFHAFITSKDILEKTAKDQPNNRSMTIGLENIRAILSADDRLLISDHPTEFWF